MMGATTASGPARLTPPGPDTRSHPHADETLQDAAMSAAEETTPTPGIFRRGGRYTFRYRDRRGRVRRGSARTIAEAKALRAQLLTDVGRGDYHPQARTTFAAYAREWVATYSGR